MMHHEQPVVLSELRVRVLGVFVVAFGSFEKKSGFVVGQHFVREFGNRRALFRARSRTAARHISLLIPIEQRTDGVQMVHIGEARLKLMKVFAHSFL